MGKKDHLSVYTDKNDLEKVRERWPKPEQQPYYDIEYNYTHGKGNI